MDGAHGAVGGLPTIRFHSDELPAREREDAWRAHIAPFFDVDPDRTAGPPGAPLAMQEIAHLGAGLIGRTEAHAQLFTRDAARVAREGIDHFLVQVFLEGGGAMPDAAVAPGDMLVIDMARPHVMLNDSFAHVTLVLPRDADPAVARLLERLHGRPLAARDPLVRLLGAHLAAVWEATPEMTPAQGAAAVRGVAGLIDVALGPAAARVEEAPREVAAALKRAIVEHMADDPGAEVTPEALARRFNVSRSMLYRMFAPEGGVLRRLRAMRLAKARRLLTEPGPAPGGRSVAAIAWDCGFRSEAHFSRAFRDRYGLSPREARDAAKAGAASAPAPAEATEGDVMARWLADLVG